MSVSFHLEYRFKEGCDVQILPLPDDITVGQLSSVLSCLREYRSCDFVSLYSVEDGVVRKIVLVGLTE